MGLRMIDSLRDIGEMVDESKLNVVLLHSIVLSVLWDVGSILHRHRLVDISCSACGPCAKTDHPLDTSR